jgi:hypothetical protein
MTTQYLSDLHYQVTGNELDLIATALKLRRLTQPHSPSVYEPAQRAAGNFIDWLMMTMLFWVLAPCILVGRCQCQSFSTEEGDNMFLRNAGIYRQVYKAPKSRRTSSSSPPWKPQILYRVILTLCNDTISEVMWRWMNLEDIYKYLWIANK